MDENSKSERLATKLAGLPNANRETLVHEWRLAYGHNPPAGLSRLLLQLSLAYRLQEKSIMRLKNTTSQTLHRIAAGAETNKMPTGPRPGTRILREWNGVMHEVTILEKGILYKGKSYRSLTEIASHITGAHWSGPRFFGLKKKSAKNE